ncbi:glutamate racemase [Candidiatus Paracoxiella cheracis]|uniref:glutamate racemase n=1 Tax=Candidiatus Paracoxiella cheracis TaxID=3405120 RepID=UPI003BF48DD7
MTTPVQQQPIGVFDSGMGGLTVLRQLKKLLPHESFIYLGDTARLPYGTKSRETVIRYAVQNTKLLIEKNIKLLVVACNTVSSVALPELKQHYPNIPIIGVLEPGAQAAVAATRNHRILVLATETTINTGGYQRVIKNLDPNATVMTKGCAVLVALAEEGWVNNSVAKAAINEYLLSIKHHDGKYDCVVLGCTHFPVFADLLREMLNNKVNIIDSAQSTAAVVEQLLMKLQLKALVPSVTRETQFFVTDSPERFMRVGELFLNHKINPDSVALVDHQQVNSFQT